MPFHYRSKLNSIIKYSDTGEHHDDGVSWLIVFKTGDDAIHSGKWIESNEWNDIEMV